MIPHSSRFSDSHPRLDVTEKGKFILYLQMLAELGTDVRRTWDGIKWRPAPLPDALNRLVSTVNTNNFNSKRLVMATNVNNRGLNFI